nr:uncharacterized protein LOC123285185 isoform X2 [Equus asinus]
MAPPQTPAKRHTAVVSKLALGIVAGQPMLHLVAESAQRYNKATGTQLRGRESYRQWPRCCLLRRLSPCGSTAFLPTLSQPLSVLFTYLFSTVSFSSHWSSWFSGLWTQLGPTPPAFLGPQLAEGRSWDVSTSMIMNCFLLEVKNGTCHGHRADHLQAGSPPGTWAIECSGCCLMNWTRKTGVCSLHVGWEA